MLTYKKYKNLKEKSATTKSYADKFKPLRIGAYSFSIFGNIASIFFAYFFFITLFSSTFFNLSGIGISIGIIIFLSLFEWIKRYVFDIFSTQFIHDNRTLKGKSKITFLVITILILALSFFFSINGAKDVINKETVFVSQIDSTSNTNTDSIKKYYSNILIELNNNTKKLQNQKDSLTNLSISALNDKNLSTKKLNIITNSITTITENIKLFKTEASKFENERDSLISEINVTSKKDLNKMSSANNANIIYFILLSFLIECIILVGVYYNRFYEHTVINEYEENVVNSVSFKNWQNSNKIIDLIFRSPDTKINEAIPSTNSLLEIIESQELNISDKELKNILKVLSYLKITETVGNKRYLKSNSENTKNLLSKYYNIQ